MKLAMTFILADLFKGVGWEGKAEKLTFCFSIAAHLVSRCVLSPSWVFAN